LDDANATSPTFEAPEGLANSDITFELQVSDGTSTSTDTVTVTVNADNDAPSAEAGANQTVEEGESVTLAGSGTDPEDQGLTYTWVQTGGPSVTLDDANATSPTFEAPEGLANSDITFELQVSDGTNTSTDTVTVTVNADNDAPVDVSAGEDQVVDEHDLVQLTGSGHDLEGQDLTYEWVQVSGPHVTLDDASAQAPSFRAPEGLVNSEVVFELHVSDGTNTVVDDVSITIHADDDAPTADAGEPFGIGEGEFAHISGAGVDPEGQGLTYEWIQISGPVVTLDDPTGPEASFLAPEEVTNTDVVFELHVSDGTNTSVDTVTITVEADNDAPESDAGSPQTVQAGAPVQLEGSGHDPENQDLTYTWTQTGGPPVALFGADSPNPTFDAPEGAGGAVTFELHVSDGVNTSIDTVTITVLESTSSGLPPEQGDDVADDPGGAPAGMAPASLLGGIPEELSIADAVPESPELGESLAEVIDYSPPAAPASVDPQILSALHPVTGSTTFEQAFEEVSLDAVKSLVGRDETGAEDSDFVDTDLSQEGVATEDLAAEDAKDPGLVAKLFGFVRGLAATNERTQGAANDKNSKNTGH